MHICFILSFRNSDIVCKDKVIQSLAFLIRFVDIDSEIIRVKILALSFLFECCKRMYRWMACSSGRRRRWWAGLCKWCQCGRPGMLVSSSDSIKNQLIHTVLLILDTCYLRHAGYHPWAVSLPHPTHLSTQMNVISINHANRNSSWYCLCLFFSARSDWHFRNEMHWDWVRAPFFWPSICKADRTTAHSPFWSLCYSSWNSSSAT